MEVKTIRLLKGAVINVIVDDRFTFLIPITELTDIVGMAKGKNRTHNLTERTKRQGYVENIHYVIHKKEDVAYFRNLKPGSRILTRIGMIALCSSLPTPEAKLLGEWASRQSCESLRNNGVIEDLFHNIIEDVERVPVPNIKARLLDSIKKLEELVR